MRHFRLNLLLLLSLANAASHAEPRPTPTTIPELRGSLEPALNWIVAHRASLQDGGLTDMIDEAVFFYIMQDLPGHPDDQACFARAFHSQTQRLDRSEAFARWVQQPGKTLLDHYHLVLASHLMGRADGPVRCGRRSWGARPAGIAAQPLLPPHRSPHGRRAAENLEVPPGVSMDELLDRSLAAGIAMHGLPPLPAGSAPRTAGNRSALFFYALVHEVIAPTDFGHLPLTDWLKKRREYVLPALASGTDWALAQGNVDLLSELMLTRHLLGENDQDLLAAVARELMVRQQADGSWGRFDTGRRNKKRHALITATRTLWLALKQITEGRLPVLTDQHRQQFCPGN